MNSNLIRKVSFGADISRFRGEITEIAVFNEIIIEIFAKKPANLVG